MTDAKEIMVSEKRRGEKFGRKGGRTGQRIGREKHEKSRGGEHMGEWKKSSRRLAETFERNTKRSYTWVK